MKRERIAGSSGRYPVYRNNPSFTLSDNANYTILEVQKSTGWTKRLIGDKVSEFGVYQLYRNNVSGKELIYESDAVGKVKTAARIGQEYFSINEAEYKFKGLKRMRIIKELISKALNP